MLPALRDPFRKLPSPEPRAGEVDAILARVSAGQVVRGLETVRRRKDGTVFPISNTVGPIRDSGGAIVGSTAIGRELRTPPLPATPVGVGTGP